jgi:hypothetical protein
MKNIIFYGIVSVMLCLLFPTCTDESNPQEEKGSQEESSSRSPIVGKWELTLITNISYVFSPESNGYEVITDTVSFSNSIIYNFNLNGALVTTGYLEDDLKAGEHTYEGGVVYDCPLCDYPGPNMLIDNVKVYCIIETEEVNMRIETLDKNSSISRRKYFTKIE